ncbi:MAG: hypothetical protein L0J52_11135 [Corynebacterium casei]|uniref:hypothetical protein n=1 Tax=Corynebacterium casei TaxID=160386 RepID=UPI0026487596|nr:hypothetical protein [Corynebacterium casei]MDN6274506.1 hypothetical protein [Corynebacterium casei]
MNIDNTQVEETNPDVQPEGTSETWGISPRDAEPMDGIEEQPVSQDGEVQEEKEEPDTFDRSYVEKLRKESAKYRDKAKRAEELEKRLHRSLVAQDGRLADPDDMEFNPDHLHDADALSDAITKLVASKPGLKAQQLSGDVGAGVREKPKPPTTDLLSIMKGLI